MKELSIPAKECKIGDYILLDYGYDLQENWIYSEIREIYSCQKLFGGEALNFLAGDPFGIHMNARFDPDQMVNIKR